MARPLRISYPGAVYHVTARGNERKAIVRNNEDRHRFVQTLATVVNDYHVICHAWVLLDNHYHLLLETPHANLSRAVRHLNGTYTQAFNRRHHRVGHLFQGRFKAILVEKETYLLELCRYVVLNPVRAGMVKHPGQWAWSSYRATAGEAPAERWLTVDWLLAQFSKRRSEAQTLYRRFVSEGIKRPCHPWENISGQIYLGSAAFLEKVASGITGKDDPEIPEVQKTPAMPTLEELLERVAAMYGVSVAGLVTPTRRPSEARQVAIFLARRVAGLELKAVAYRFGISYTGVSRRVSKVAKRTKNETEFGKRVEKLMMAK